MRKLAIPHTYVLLFMIVIVVAVGTYVVPAGVFERYTDEATGRTLVDPDSFHHVEPTPVGFFDVFASVPKGMIAAGEVIFFIFIVGGAFTIIQATGAIDAGISKVVLQLKGREKLLIPATMFVFSLGGLSFGMSEETIVFIPMGVALARAVGFDPIVGTAIISTGAAVGFAGGILNPFTVGVAQSVAELPLFSGIGIRVVGYALLFLGACYYVMRYASKVKEDPKSSIVYDLFKDEEVPGHYTSESTKLTSSHKLVLLVVVLFFAYMIYGVMAKGYYIMELATIFLAMGVISGFVGGLTPNAIGRAFADGTKSIAFGALVVGIARAILVVMTEGQIIDTVIYALANWVSHLPGALSAAGMFWVQSVINFFIPSGSGQAMATMPIMAPIADLIGVTRQTAVLAYQYGDGFTNQIIPTSGVLMATLGMAKIPYDRWFKFIWPLMIFWHLIGTAMVIIAHLVGYGPF
ncbi:YfcC family protein [Acetomicrobium sp.]|uniref:YfcC family protein n=1 Tax=Acetomicrobium sp. TaxID=1872099 RepID=UPI001BD0E26D|nr:YfcC family protein [Acetomicrobium sp.]